MEGFSPKVAIYCKIGCDQFPTPPWCDDDCRPVRATTGNEIFAFLNADCGYAFMDGEDEPLPGDKVIWYLGTCLKAGVLSIDEWRITWGMGGASPTNVISFIEELYRRTIINAEQQDSLLKEAVFAEGMFADCYDIRDYLSALTSGKEYRTPNEEESNHGRGQED